MEDETTMDAVKIREATESFLEQIIKLLPEITDATYSARARLTLTQKMPTHYQWLRVKAASAKLEALSRAIEQLAVEANKELYE